MHDFFPPPWWKRVWSNVKRFVAPAGVVLGILGTTFWGVFKLRGGNSVTPRVEDPTRRVQRAQERLNRVTENQQQSDEFSKRVGEFAEKQRDAYERAEDTLDRATERAGRIENIIGEVNSRHKVSGDPD